MRASSPEGSGWGILKSKNKPLSAMNATSSSNVASHFELPNSTSSSWSWRGSEVDVIDESVFMGTRSGDFISFSAVCYHIWILRWDEGILMGKLLYCLYIKGLLGKSWGDKIIDNAFENSKTGKETSEMFDDFSVKSIRYVEGCGE